MASALAGPSSMDVDHAQYHSISSTSFMTDDFNERPKFIKAARLKKLYGCAICNDVVVQPHQTPCGNRVCKKCIEEKFGSLSVIKCPLPHDDMDEEELKEEQCQQEGLVRDAVVPDPGSQRFLLREKCFCENQEYGCCENPPWKKLKEHQAICAFVPDRCPNQGCYKLFAKKDLQRHMAECEFGIVKCNFCQQSFNRKDMEEHLEECDYADSECTICGTKFEKRKPSAQGNVKQFLITKTAEFIYNFPQIGKNFLRDAYDGVFRDAMVLVHGYRTNPQFKKLKAHQTLSVPDRCPNQGCYKLFAKKDLQRHTAECDFGIVKCNFCQQSLKRKDLEEHLGDCVYADSECTICGTKFEKRKQEHLEECDYADSECTQRQSKVRKKEQPDSDSSSSWESEIDFTRGEYLLCRRWGARLGAQ